MTVLCKEYMACEPSESNSGIYVALEYSTGVQIVMIVCVDVCDCTVFHSIVIVLHVILLCQMRERLHCRTLKLVACGTFWKRWRKETCMVNLLM